MRKLFILKTIIDILWIISLITIPIILLAIPAIFFLKEPTSNFKIIGNTLVISGLLLMISTFIYKIYTESIIEIELGFSTNIIIICFGLFSLVLSEIFKISKTLKQENELTI